MSPPTGALYLVPTPLDFGTAETAERGATDWLPASTLAVAARLSHWVTENAKSTRAFLKRVDAVAGLAAPLQAMTITELPRAAHKHGDHRPDAALDAQARALIAPALAGHDVGLVSEAGMPAVADPGSAVVRAAHAAGVRVVPLVGPVSLVLALAASGMNGQAFAFVGYVPQAAADRQRRLRELEARARDTGETQVLIETPYRNAALLDALLQTLKGDTRLAVAVGLGLTDERVVSLPVATWRQRGTAGLALDRPAVFLIGR